MQRSATPSHQTAAPFFSSLFGGGGHNNHNNNNNNNNNNLDEPSSSWSPNAKSPGRSRPSSSGEGQQQGRRSGDTGASPRQHNVLHKNRDRRPSFSRKPSFTFTSSPKHRANSTSASSSAANGGPPRPPAIQLFPDNNPVPPLPDLSAVHKLSKETEVLIQSPASAESFSKMLSRTAPTPVNGYSASQLAPPPVLTTGASSSQPTELSLVHQHIQETANKRISTLDYLRKAHEGRIYWFNTMLFDKPDLQRMPYFLDTRKLAKRATNYLLLGISLPAVIDLNSNSAVEFLKSFNTLLTEFDTFQQLHNENGQASSSLSRARIPQMFRRAAAPVSYSKGRRSSSSTVPTMGSMGGGAAANDPSIELADSSSGMGAALAPTLTNSSVNFPGTAPPAGAGAATNTPSAAMNFTGAELIDLLPGEEYTHLLTPSLPFDPDFFETFATLCDVLIDTYTRLLGLLPTPRECGGSVAELFTKVDGKVRKLLVANVIREFEDSSRQGVKAEVASVGKVVLSGLM